MTELSTKSETGRRHFHTFDALRFLAVFKVFLQHTPIEAFPWFNYVKSGGFTGVYFFFVLSGFLITYIIYNERVQTGRLSLKNFFARRILRIWPLFYLFVLLCYLLPPAAEYLGVSLSEVGYKPKLWISLLFLENYRLILTHEMPTVFPLAAIWTLCVEEHFYIIWGLLLLLLPLRHLPKLIITCIALGFLSRMIFVTNGLDPSVLTGRLHYRTDCDSLVDIREMEPHSRCYHIRPHILPANHAYPATGRIY